MFKVLIPFTCCCLHVTCAYFNCICRLNSIYLSLVQICCQCWSLLRNACCQEETYISEEEGGTTLNCSLHSLPDFVLLVSPNAGHVSDPAPYCLFVGLFWFTCLFFLRCTLTWLFAVLFIRLLKATFTTLQPLQTSPRHFPLCHFLKHKHPVVSAFWLSLWESTGLCHDWLTLHDWFLLLHTCKRLKKTTWIFYKEGQL